MNMAIIAKAVTTRRIDDPDKEAVYNEIVEKFMSQDDIKLMREQRLNLMVYFSSI